MKFSTQLELGPYFTFEPSKSKPIYNWFYYKEAYSPEIVEHFIFEFGLKAGATILDPFSGIGTTALAAKSLGFKAYGVDASQLAVFVSRVKTRNYSDSDIEEARAFMKTIFQEKSAPNLHWNFELFPVQKAFPPANLRDILFIREKIQAVKSENAHDLLLLALLSIIPMCSFVLKDGGVLKLVKKSVAPAKEMFKRKVKRMLSDLENPIIGPQPRIEVGDARSLSYKSGTMDAIITSPPYLNNIDYTKVYGLETSLLEIDPFSTKVARGRSIRSFISSDSKSPKVPEEIGNIGYRIPVAGAYFSDMENVLRESFRVLKPNAWAAFVVGNAVLHQTHIAVDEILAQIGERLGFEAEIIVGLERIADVKPSRIKTRESVILFRKP